MKTVARTREQLEIRIRTLEGRLKEIDAILRQPEDSDVEERASEWDDDEVLDRLGRALKDEIGLIRAALRRIADGSYGRCQACGKSIGQRRLRALPQAERCVQCANATA